MKNTFFILAILLASACKEKVVTYDRATTAKIEQTVKSLNQEMRLTSSLEKVYFVNIDAGCESCIDECLTFAKKEQDNDHLLFVIVSAHKNAIDKVSNQYSLKNSPTHGVIFDNKYLAYKNGIVDVFPKVCYLQNKEVIDVKSIDASNIDKLLMSN